MSAVLAIDLKPPSQVLKEVSADGFGSITLVGQPLDGFGLVQYWACENFAQVLEVALRQVVGWKDFVDAQGKEVPFSYASLCRIMASYPDLGFQIQSFAFSLLPGKKKETVSTQSLSESPVSPVDSAQVPTGS